MTLVPITPAMLTPAYVPVFTTDGGAVGNDWDVATATVILDDRGVGMYAPRTQVGRATLAPTAYTGIAGDIGKDYGEYTGLTGRDGTITPLDPYPVTAPEPPPEPEP